MSGERGDIRIGIGGWTFEPWRGIFYPAGLPHKRELEYASRQVTSIEVNGTFYGTQKPESFARWYDETPDGFVLSLKGPRFATNRRALAEAGSSVERFLSSGVLLLKEKLGPINWQFSSTKQFDPVDFEAFLKLLPGRVEEQDIRHVVEVRHPSFVHADFIALLRSYGVGVVIADSEKYPALYDPTAAFVYLRLQRGSDQEKLGYSAQALDQWGARARAWSAGKLPADLKCIAPDERDALKHRDVFIYVINGFKPKAPAAAMALIERVASSSTRRRVRR